MRGARVACTSPVRIWPRRMTKHDGGIPWVRVCRNSNCRGRLRGSVKLTVLYPLGNDSIVGSGLSRSVIRAETDDAISAVHGVSSDIISSPVSGEIVVDPGID